MRRLLRVVVVIAVASIAIGAILSLEFADISSRRELANTHPHQPSAYARQKENAAAQIGALIAWLDVHHELINVASTILIAAFTGTLWGATRKLGYFAETQASDMQRLLGAARDNATAAASQAEAMRQLRAAAELQEQSIREQATATQGLLEHTPQIERAYISGGGPREFILHRTLGQMGAYGPLPDTVTQIATGNFALQINNHGKTPGELIKYGIGFCEADNVPPTPNYKWKPFRDWIGPGTQSRPLVPIEIPRALAAPVVYGRFCYKDIFGDEHSSGFILKITETGTEPIIPPTEEYTDSD